MIKRMKEGVPLFGDEDVGIVEDEPVFRSKKNTGLDPSDNHKDIHSNQEWKAIKRVVRLTNGDIDKVKGIKSEDIDKLKEIKNDDVDKLKGIDNNPKKETKIRERYIEEELI